MKELSFLKSRLIAHRGIFDNKRIYENTISSFSRAMKNNYIIELDVRMLIDGTLVVFHDENTERMIHVEGMVEKMTYDELTYMARYQIPTLEEVLKLVDNTVPLLIDLKSVIKKKIFESKVAEILDQYTGEFAIQSFNIKTIKWFYKNRPNYVIGYLIGKRNYKKEYFFKKYDFVNIRYDIYSDKKIRKMREDKVVLGFGISTKEQYLSKRDVYDNLTCDNLLEIAES